MTDVPPSAQPEMSDASAVTRPHHSVVVAVTAVPGVDPSATLERVQRQSHPVTTVVLVGEGGMDWEATAGTVEDVVASLDPDTDYLWILHGDAEPRPDALSALVEEAERHEASLVGSKLLVAGTRDTLEGIGSATDVFGEPYTGLDEGEVDLEQYDVVRDVAFVSSVSMLVRRDLMKGLRGLDPALPPNAAGLDLSQRVRIAGGRVMVAPSSEVFHHRRCGRGDGGWREQAGRLRAMLKGYRPITLVWMVPFALLVGVLDSVGSLALGRWRLIPRYLLTWAWNIWKLPSTVSSRRAVARVRQVRDEELFRYQVRGSVRLRGVGSELADRLIGVFDEDRPLAKRATEVWSSPGTWGALGAIVAIVIGVRAVFVGSLPVVGHSLPFPASAVTALGRFLGGWNAAGLGTDAAVHPSTAIAAGVQVVLFDNPGLARSVVTLAAFVAGVFGLARLGSRLRVGGLGAYIGGVVAMFGPPAAFLAAAGRWSGLVAVGVLPWALSSVLGPQLPGWRRRLGAGGRALVLVWLLGALAPVLAIAPVVFSLAVRVLGRFPARPVRAAAASAGALVGVPYLMSHPATLLQGLPVPVDVGVITLAGLAMAVLAGMVGGTWRASGMAGVMVFGGLVVARATGPETQIAALAVAAVGSGLAVAAALRRVEVRRTQGWVAFAGGLVVVAMVLPGLAGGRAGLPPDAWGSSLSFIGIEPRGPERALVVAPSPQALPGESRPGPGFWYRLVDVEGPTLDQAMLGEPGPGDAALGDTLATIMAGASLEPGEALAEFGVRWVVTVEESIALLGPVLDAQMDLESRPLGDDLLVYANTAAMPVAVDDQGRPWASVGDAYQGPAGPGRVSLALQGDSRWIPDWQPEDWRGTVSAADGEARFAGDRTNRAITIAALVLLGCSAVIGVWGRARPW